MIKEMFIDNDFSLKKTIIVTITCIFLLSPLKKENPQGNVHLKIMSHDFIFIMNPFPPTMPFYFDWFVLIWFYGISIFVVRLMPNPFYPHTLDLWIASLNVCELNFFLSTVELFHLFLSNAKNSIYYYSFVSYNQTFSSTVI